MRSIYWREPNLEQHIARHRGNWVAASLKSSLHSTLVSDTIFRLWLCSYCIAPRPHLNSISCSLCHGAMVRWPISPIIPCTSDTQPSQGFSASGFSLQPTPDLGLD